MSKDEERILTKHPEGKTGVSISKQKYDLVRATMLDCLKDRELTEEDLTACVTKKLRSRFEGSMKWYGDAVRLDLEARGDIRRHQDKGSNIYRLKD